MPLQVQEISKLQKGHSRYQAYKNSQYLIKYEIDTFLYLAWTYIISKIVLAGHCPFPAPATCTRHSALASYEELQQAVLAAGCIGTAIFLFKFVASMAHDCTRRNFVLKDHCRITRGSIKSVKLPF